jgi:peptide chain release factor
METMIRLLVTSGRGPAECRLAVARALQQMEHEAERLDIQSDIVSGAAPDKHGPGSAIVILSGTGTEVFAADWTGTALWVSPSPLRPKHRRKNWFIGVFRLDAIVPAGSLRSEDVRFDTLRAGGPGGQHQNTTDSAVRAVHGPTGLAVVARSERSQHRNKAAALARLAAMLEQRAELQRIEQDKAAWEVHLQLQRGGAVRKL